MAKVATKVCPRCGRQDQFDVTEDELNSFLRGAFVQQAFPNLNAGQREQLITGYDDKCWEEMMGPEPTD